jgi:glycosyltransferase involved in cell wall biosynthesis
MKIVYAITKGNWGGAQKYVFDLAVAARDAGHTVKVIYGIHGKLIEKLKEVGIDTIALPPTPREVRIGSDVRTYQAFKKILEQERPDVMHLNSSKIGGIGSAAARAVGIQKIIFTAHGWAFNEKRPLWQRVLIFISHYVTILLCTKTICVSKAVLHDVQYMPFVQKRLSVIYNGIDTDATKLIPQEVARVSLLRSIIRNAEVPDNAKWIGTIAELHPTKNLDVLIRAFAALPSQSHPLILIVIGDGESRTQLEQLAVGCGVYDRVFFLGHIADAGHYLKALDIFVLPSHSEALGIALLEAGAARVPVVATSVGGIPEVIINGKTGLLVPPDVVPPLTKAISQLLHDFPLAHQFATALHTKVTNEF